MYYKQQQAKLKYEGNIFETKDGKQFIVTEYVNKDEVYVKFLATGFETKTIASCVRKGEIKDPMSPTVLGVGVTGLCNIRENGNLSMYTGVVCFNESVTENTKTTGYHIKIALYLTTSDTSPTLKNGVLNK